MPVKKKNVKGVVVPGIPFFYGEVIFFKVFVFLGFGVCGTADTQIPEGTSGSTGTVPVFTFVNKFLDHSPFGIKGDFKEFVFVNNFRSCKRDSQKRRKKVIRLFSLLLSF